MAFGLAGFGARQLSSDVESGQDTPEKIAPSEKEDATSDTESPEHKAVDAQIEQIHERIAGIPSHLPSLGVEVKNTSFTEQAREQLKKFRTKLRTHMDIKSDGEFMERVWANNLMTDDGPVLAPVRVALVTRLPNHQLMKYTLEDGTERIELGFPNTLVSAMNTGIPEDFQSPSLASIHMFQLEGEDFRVDGDDVLNTATYTARELPDALEQRLVTEYLYYVWQQEKNNEPFSEFLSAVGQSSLMQYVNTEYVAGRERVRAKEFERFFGSPEE